MYVKCLLSKRSGRFGRVKSPAWLATFPGTNPESASRSSPTLAGCWSFDTLMSKLCNSKSDTAKSCAEKKDRVCRIDFSRLFIFFPFVIPVRLGGGIQYYER